jgi:two-component system, NarL family, nitrate/nitrite response regulator NarL
MVCSPVRLYRDGLVEALRRTGQLVVVGATVAARLPSAAAEAGPDLVVVDASERDTTATIQSLHAVCPDVRVIVLAAPDSEETLMSLAEAGVAAYITRDQPLEELLETIRAALRGEAVCSPRTTAMLLRRVTVLASSLASFDTSSLTRRELEIAELVAAGLSNKQIASRLQIELPTVKNHVHHVLTKLAVERRSQVVARLADHASASTGST